MIIAGILINNEISHTTATNKMKKTNLETFHNTCYSKKPYAYFLIANKEKIKMSDLEKFGNVKELTLEEIFGY